LTQASFNDLLNQVFAQLPMPAQANKKVVQPFVVPLEQVPQICDLTLTDSQHQLVIGRRIHAFPVLFSSIVSCKFVRQSSKLRRREKVTHNLRLTIDD